MSTVTAAEATQAFGLDPVLDKLREAASFFGAGDIGEEVEEAAVDFADREMDWAGAVWEDWRNTAPWATGNLRDSIDVDESDFPKSITVGVDLDQLLARAGQEVPTERTIYNGKPSTIPNFDYTEAIDANQRIDGKQYKAVSAGETSKASREYATHTHTPFIREIWFALAEKRKKEIFG